MTLSPFLAETAALLPALLGPAVGSFLGVLADRLPRREDVVRARSACRGCGARLGARDLVPILSFAVARGRCRHCGAAIPGWLLHLEIAASGAGLLAVLAGGGAVQVWLSAVLLWSLLGLAATDLLWFRLPDALNAALLLAAAGLAATRVWPGFWASVAAAAAGVAAFALLRAGYRWMRGREGLGAGDVRLMAGLGLFAGPVDLPRVVLAAALALIVAALATPRPGRRLGARPMPFGAALCLAAAGLWFLRATGS